MSNSLVTGHYLVNGVKMYYDAKTNQWYITNGFLNTPVKSPIIVSALQFIYVSWPTPINVVVGQSVTFHVAYTYQGPADSTNYKLYGTLGVKSDTQFAEFIDCNVEKPLHLSAYSVPTVINDTIVIPIGGNAASHSNVGFQFKIITSGPISIDKASSNVYLGVFSVPGPNATITDLTIGTPVKVS